MRGVRKEGRKEGSKEGRATFHRDISLSLSLLDRTETAAANSFSSSSWAALSINNLVRAFASSLIALQPWLRGKGGEKQIKVSVGGRGKGEKSWSKNPAGFFIVYQRARYRCPNKRPNEHTPSLLLFASLPVCNLQESFVF
jgi:hypothetical protein